MEKPCQRGAKFGMGVASELGGCPHDRIRTRALRAMSARELRTKCYLCTLVGKHRASKGIRCRFLPGAVVMLRMTFEARRPYCVVPAPERSEPTEESG